MRSSIGVQEEARLTPVRGVRYSVVGVTSVGVRRAGSGGRGGPHDFDVFPQVHWVGAVVAAVVWCVMGAAWYIAPPISRRWQAAGGIEIAEDQQPDPKIIVLTFLA
jgi:hypothetical protein